MASTCPANARPVIVTAATVDAFIAIMNSYKKGERDNKAMVSVAKSLDDEQIAALAAYFATIKPKDQ